MADPYLNSKADHSTIGGIFKYESQWNGGIILVITFNGKVSTWEIFFHGTLVFTPTLINLTLEHSWAARVRSHDPHKSCH